jgi:hypothetical protein
VDDPGVYDAPLVENVWKMSTALYYTLEVVVEKRRQMNGSTDSEAFEEENGGQCWPWWKICIRHI